MNVVGVSPSSIVRGTNKNNTGIFWTILDPTRLSSDYYYGIFCNWSEPPSNPPVFVVKNLSEVEKWCRRKFVNQDEGTRWEPTQRVQYMGWGLFWSSRSLFDGMVRGQAGWHGAEYHHVCASVCSPRPRPGVSLSPPGRARPTLLTTPHRPLRSQHQLTTFGGVKITRHTD